MPSIYWSGAGRSRAQDIVPSRGRDLPTPAKAIRLLKRLVCARASINSFQVNGVRGERPRPADPLTVFQLGDSQQVLRSSCSVV